MECLQFKVSKVVHSFTDIHFIMAVYGEIAFWATGELIFCNLSVPQTWIMPDEFVWSHSMFCFLFLVWFTF